MEIDVQSVLLQLLVVVAVSTAIGAALVVRSCRRRSRTGWVDVAARLRSGPPVPGMHLTRWHPRRLRTSPGVLEPGHVLGGQPPVVLTGAVARATVTLTTWRDAWVVTPGLVRVVVDVAGSTIEIGVAPVDRDGVLADLAGPPDPSTRSTLR